MKSFFRKFTLSKGIGCMLVTAAVSWKPRNGDLWWNANDQLDPNDR
jgi:hypothetical protein